MVGGNRLGRIVGRGSSEIQEWSPFAPPKGSGPKDIELHGSTRRVEKPDGGASDHTASLAKIRLGGQGSVYSVHAIPAVRKENNGSDTTSRDPEPGRPIQTIIMEERMR